MNERGPIKRHLPNAWRHGYLRLVYYRVNHSWTNDRRPCLSCRKRLWVRSRIRGCVVVEPSWIGFLASMIWCVMATEIHRVYLLIIGVQYSRVPRENSVSGHAISLHDGPIQSNSYRHVLLLLPSARPWWTIRSMPSSSLIPYVGMSPRLQKALRLRHS